MNTILKKLRSQAGASITFALLLFLVCAVLCSVIITAATASAGRMSGIAETDQRYYAVTSASELLKDLIGDKTVSIVKVTTSWSTVTYTDGVPGSPVNNMDGYIPKNPDVKEYLIVDKNASEILSKVGEDDDYLIPINQISGDGEAGQQLIKESIVNDAAYKYYDGQKTIPEIPEASPRPLYLESTDSLKTNIGIEDGDIDPLEVTIEEKLDNTGRITLTIYNGIDNNAYHYKQQLEFSLNVDSKNKNLYENSTIQNEIHWTTQTDDEVPIYTNHIRYTITTTKTAIEIKTMNWTLDMIKTL